MAAERRCERLAQTSAARVDDLAQRVAASAVAAAANAPLAAQAQLQHLEEDATALVARIAELEKAAKSQSAWSKWRVLSRVAEYQRAVRDATREADAARAQAEQQCAALQVALHDANRRAEAAAQELRVVQQRAASTAREFDVDRQAMAERHLAQITVGL